MKFYRHSSPLWILKDDGNEGSNNSALLLSKLFPHSRCVCIKYASGRKLIYPGNRKLPCLNLTRINKASYFSLVIVLMNIPRIIPLIAKSKSSCLIVNNCLLIDFILAAIICRKKTFVFIRESHMPRMLVKILDLLSRMGLVSLLSNSLSSIRRYRLGNALYLPSPLTIPHSSTPHFGDAPSNNISALCVGGIYPLKNQMALISIAKQLVKLYPNIVICQYGRVCSRGYMDKILKKIKTEKLEDNIQFMGELNNEKLLQIYPQYTFYIQTSRSEGLSRSLMDAVQHGLIPIVTDVGDTNTIVDPTFSILINPDSPVLPADRLQQLVSSRKICAEANLRCLISRHSQYLIQSRMAAMGFV
jgi:glycosyltransferase involved in cell wall biosynthesis